MTDRWCAHCEKLVACGHGQTGHFVDHERTTLLVVCFRFLFPNWFSLFVAPDFSAPGKSRLNAPQLQAQFSRSTDRARLRRLKRTLLSEGAWQQVTRLEDLCHNARLPQVTLPLGRVCGKCPGAHTTTSPTCRKDSETEHGQDLASAVCAAPSRSTRRSYTRTPRMRSRCGVRIETRRPRHLFTNAAARGDAAQASFDRKLSTTGMISQTCETRVFTIEVLCGQRTGDRTQPSLEHCSLQRTSHPAGAANRCRPKSQPFGTGRGALRWQPLIEPFHADY